MDKVEYVVGVCPACGEVVRRKAPAEIGVCDFCLTDVKLSPENCNCEPEKPKDAIIRHREVKVKIPKRKHRVKLNPREMAVLEEVSKGRGSAYIFDAKPPVKIIPLACDKCGKPMKYVGNNTWECRHCEE